MKASKEAGLVTTEKRESLEASLTHFTREISELRTTINSSKDVVFQGMVRSLLLGTQVDTASGQLAAYLNGEETCVFLIHVPDVEMERMSVEQLQAEYQPGQRDYDVLITSLEKVPFVAILIGKEGMCKEAGEAFVREIKDHWQECQIVFPE